MYLYCLFEGPDKSRNYPKKPETSMYVCSYLYKAIKLYLICLLIGNENCLNFDNINFNGVSLTILKIRSFVNKNISTEFISIFIIHTTSTLH